MPKYAKHKINSNNIFRMPNDKIVFRTEKQKAMTMKFRVEETPLANKKKAQRILLSQIVNEPYSKAFYCRTNTTKSTIITLRATPVMSSSSIYMTDFRFLRI